MKRLQEDCCMLRGIVIVQQYIHVTWRGGGRDPSVSLSLCVRSFPSTLAPSLARKKGRDSGDRTPMSAHAGSGKTF